MLDEPEFEGVQQAWFEEAGTGSGPGVPGLNYLTHAQEVEGHLWVLMNTESERFAKLVRVSADGGTQRVQVSGVQGAQRFVVDESAGWIYFYIADTAEVIRVAFREERETANSEGT